MQIDARRCSGARHLQRGRVRITGPRTQPAAQRDTRLHGRVVRCLFWRLVSAASLAADMVIRTDLSALKRTKWYEYSIRFVFGGLITAIAGAVATTYGPVIGGLFLAFPAVFPAAATLIARHEREKKEEKLIDGERRGAAAAAVESEGAVMGSVGLAVFAFLCWQVLPRYNPVLVLIAATLAWVASSSTTWYAKRLVRVWRSRTGLKQHARNAG